MLNIISKIVRSVFQGESTEDREVRVQAKVAHARGNLQFRDPGNGWPANRHVLMPDTTETTISRVVILQPPTEFIVYSVDWADRTSSEKIADAIADLMVSTGQTMAVGAVSETIIIN